MKNAVWKTIGHCAVDSGTLMVIDPGYAIGFSEKDYGKYIIDKCHEQVVKIPFDLGHEGKAVVFASGIGDGYYEIKAKFEQLDPWGERITEVRIIMDKDIKRVTKALCGRKKNECFT